jgi:hypothetical protein
LVEVSSGGAVRVVLANTTASPVCVRAGEIVAYARPAGRDEFDVVECNLDVDGESISSPVRSVGWNDEGRVRSVRVQDPTLADNPFYSPTAAAGSDSVETTTQATAELNQKVPIGTITEEEVQGILDKLSPEARTVVGSARRVVEGAGALPAHLLDIQLGDHLTQPQKAVALALLRQYADVFNDSRTIPTRTPKFRASIDTGSAQPVSSAPYRVSPSERKVIDGAIDDMLKAGVIRPSRSPWGAPVVLVPKKDGSIRFCVDYRRLNKVTKIETYPLPRIDEALRAFQGATCFSVVDMQSGYWQVPLNEDSVPKTAFITHRGLFEYVVLPFGPVNAPGYFQRMMDEVVGGLKWTSVLVYIDDLIVFSPSVERHADDLRVVFDRLRSAGLTLKPKKCQLFAASVKYLGQVVSAEGIAPDEDKVKAIRRMPYPTNKHEVKAFLGLAGYYRRFVRNFAKMVEPIQRLTRADVPFAWGAEESRATDAVKEALCGEKVMLTHPDFSTPFTVMTDASGTGIGAVLSQVDPVTKEERVVEYASRSLTKAERLWSATEQEALAVKWACEVMRPYVYGSRFTVITDHKALQWVYTHQTTNPKLQRWALQLSEYDFKIIHRPGRTNANADGPSRLPLPLGAGR